MGYTVRISKRVESKIKTTPALRKKWGGWVSSGKAHIYTGKDKPTRQKAKELRVFLRSEGIKDVKKQERAPSTLREEGLIRKTKVVTPEEKKQPEVKPKPKEIFRGLPQSVLGETPIIKDDKVIGIQSETLKQSVTFDKPMSKEEFAGLTGQIAESKPKPKPTVLKEPSIEQFLKESRIVPKAKLSPQESMVPSDIRKEDIPIISRFIPPSVIDKQISSIEAEPLRVKAFKTGVLGKIEDVIVGSRGKAITGLRKAEQVEKEISIPKEEYIKKLQESQKLISKQETITQAQKKEMEIPPPSLIESLSKIPASITIGGIKLFSGVVRGGTDILTIPFEFKKDPIGTTKSLIDIPSQLKGAGELIVKDPISGLATVGTSAFLFGKATKPIGKVVSKVSPKRVTPIKGVDVEIIKTTVDKRGAPKTTIDLAIRTVKGKPKVISPFKKIPKPKQELTIKLEEVRIIGKQPTGKTITKFIKSEDVRIIGKQPTGKTIAKIGKGEATLKLKPEVKLKTDIEILKEREVVPGLKRLEPVKLIKVEGIREKRIQVKPSQRELKIRGVEIQKAKEISFKSIQDISKPREIFLTKEFIGKKTVPVKGFERVVKQKIETKLITEKKPTGEIIQIDYLRGEFIKKKREAKPKPTKKKPTKKIIDLDKEYKKFLKEKETKPLFKEEKPVRDFIEREQTTIQKKQTKLFKEEPIISYEVEPIVKAKEIKVATRFKEPKPSARLIDISKAKEELKIPSKLSMKAMLKIDPIDSLQIKPIIETDVKPSQELKLISAPDIADKLKPKVDLLVSQMADPKITPIQKQFIGEKLKTFPEEPTIPLTTKKMPSLLSKKKIKSEKEEPAVYTYVKEKGKYNKAHKYPLKESVGKNLGATIAENTPVATFKTVETDAKPKEWGGRRLQTFESLKKQFTKKGNRFVEKRKYRINTQGEILGITVKGFLSKKKKSYNSLI